MLVDFSVPRLLGHVGGKPRINFSWKKVGSKSRLIGNPNKPLRLLHELFGRFLRERIFATDESGYGLRKLPSSTGAVRGSNPLRNALRHAEGKFFYITDLAEAYQNVSLERLALLIVYLVEFTENGGDISFRAFGEDDRREYLREHPFFPEVLDMLSRYFAGPGGTGLAVGGPLSPFLMNLYCEVYLDAPLRRFLPYRGLTYTRYVDDLVFSSSFVIGSDTRRILRGFISQSGFGINHEKSKILSMTMGTVHITKIGLSPQVDGSVRLVFSQKKRRKLHGMIKSYLRRQSDWPEKVSGYIAEFLHYYKNVAVKTRTDLKTFRLCKEFEAEWSKYKTRSPKRRR
jgi:hypothetical protein